MTRGSAMARFGWPGLLLVLAALLRGWELERAGFGTSYYAAGVLSMGMSLSNFLFAAFDPAGFLALDKPPLAFWPQVLATKLMGFGALALHLPQVLEGVAAVALLRHLVARRFGAVAGLMAGLALAVTPVSVAIDRSNNTDSLLVLAMLLAAWPLILAAERGQRHWLLISAAALGLAFNVKMAAALVVLPAGVLLYWCAAPLARWRRVGDLAAAGGVLAVVALSWPLLVEAVPPEARPYVDSTEGNSVLELVVGHNAMDRFIRPAWLRRPEARVERPAAATQAPVEMVPAGPGRLFHARLAAQMAWLLPLALAGLVLAWRGGGRERQAALLWGGWGLACWAVYSAAGGIFLPYYVAPLAPALAALAGIGAVRLGGAWAVGLGLLATAGWQGWILWSGDAPAYLAAGPVLAGALVLALLGSRRVEAGRWAGVAALMLAPVGATLAMLAGPAEPLMPGVRLQPVAARRAQPPDFTRLRAYAEANRGGARFLLATRTAREAAGLILASGAPVLALGGYTGEVPVLTPERLAELAARGELRFVLLGRAVGVQEGQADAQQALLEWVRQAGRPVDPALWRPDVPPGRDPAARRMAGYVAGLRLYEIGGDER